jgi:hypothetical protein
MIGRTTAVQGIMQRSTDEAAMKHSEDSKSVVNQLNAHQLGEKEVLQKSQEVIKKDDADYNQENYDAKEKGKGEYLFTPKKKKKQNEEDDGKVIIKGTGGFDVKI